MNRTRPLASPLLPLALATTWIVWGSTFLAMHVALERMPPFVMMGTRFAAAGVIVLVAARMLGGRMPRLDRAAVVDAVVVGTGLVAVGMGATSWAVSRLPTGAASLLAASAPLWVALLTALTSRRAPGPRAGAGLLVGVTSASMLFSGGGGEAIDPVAASVLVLGNLGWAGAVVFAAARPSPASIVEATALRMLVGGGMLLLVALVSGEVATIGRAAVAPDAVGAWVYLAVFGSVAGYLAHAWLVEHAGATLASTHAFVNPLVAVALGAVLLHEATGMRTLLAAAGIVVAVTALLADEGRPATSASRAAASGSSPTRARAGRGWSPAPTPAFAARRVRRPSRVTDGMDALAIDEAMDSARG